MSKLNNEKNKRLLMNADFDYLTSRMLWYKYGLVRQSAFLAQQAVEKYLKVLIFQKSAKFEWGHNILELINKSGIDLPEDLGQQEKIDFLTALEQSSRYVEGGVMDEWEYGDEYIGWVDKLVKEIRSLIEVEKMIDLLGEIISGNFSERWLVLCAMRAGTPNEFRKYLYHNSKVYREN